MRQLLLVDGDVRTMDPRRPRMQAVAVRGSTIVAVGTTREVLSWRERGDVVVRLRGRTVVPGLNDAHAHLLSYALGRRRLRLERMGKDMVLKGIQDAARHQPRGTWILGRGWNHNLWAPKVLPDRHDLDRVAPGHPVSLVSHDGHAIWANTRAIEAAGIDRVRKDPPKGRIVRDVHGAPTGILLEHAIELMSARIPPPTAAVRRQAISELLPLLHAHGITSVQVIEADDSLTTLLDLAEDGRLPLRVAFFVPVETWRKTARHGMRTKLPEDRFRVGGVKVFADGTLSSQTAAMVAPFEGTSDRGMLLLSERELKRVTREVNRAGLSVLVHAIGDRAVRATLDAFAAALPDAQRWDLRNRVEHAEVISPADVKRFQRLGVIASVQPNQIFADISTAEKLWGQKRCARAFPLRSLWQAEAIVAFGSDCPVEDVAPLPGIYAAVARTRMDGTPHGGWHPEEALTVEEAIWAYTMGSAYASHEEDRKGSITPGKVADLVVLSNDMFTGSPRRILEAQVDMTIFDGEVVFER